MEKIFIPKDEYSSGNIDSGCWAKLYGLTENEVTEKKHRYFQSYNPLGYGTHVVSSGKNKTGYYYCFIARWHSCD